MNVAIPKPMQASAPSGGSSPIVSETGAASAVSSGHGSASPAACSLTCFKTSLLGLLNSSAIYMQWIEFEGPSWIKDEEDSTTSSELSNTEDGLTGSIPLEPFDQAALNNASPNKNSVSPSAQSLKAIVAGLADKTKTLSVDLSASKSIDAKDHTLSKISAKAVDETKRQSASNTTLLTQEQTISLQDAAPLASNAPIVAVQQQSPESSLCALSNAENSWGQCSADAPSGKAGALQSQPFDTNEVGSAPVSEFVNSARAALKANSFSDSFPQESIGAGLQVNVRSGANRTPLNADRNAVTVALPHIASEPNGSAYSSPAGTVGGNSIVAVASAAEQFHFESGCAQDESRMRSHTGLSSAASSADKDRRDEDAPSSASAPSLQKHDSGGQALPSEAAIETTDPDVATNASMPRAQTHNLASVHMPTQETTASVAQSNMIAPFQGSITHPESTLESEVRAQAEFTLPSQNPFSAVDGAGADSRAIYHSAASRSAEAGYDDPMLGRVSVRAEVGAGAGIRAELIADNAAAASVLVGHMSGLSQHLNEQHTPIESLTLTAQNHEQSGGQFNGSRQNDQPQSDVWISPASEDKQARVKQDESPLTISAVRSVAASGSLHISVVA